MKASELIGQMTFSHRPQDGISVGFAVIAGVAYMAVGFVRDGDSFNRKLARNILAQRILTTLETDKGVRFVRVWEHCPANVDVRSLVREFRKVFKPDHTCNDRLFSRMNVGGENQPTWLIVDSRDIAFTKIDHMFTAAITAASNAPARVTQ